MIIGGQKFKEITNKTGEEDYHFVYYEKDKIITKDTIKATIWL